MFYLALIYYFIYTLLHLAGAVQKSDIHKSMWVYLNDLSRRTRPLSRWKVISCENDELQTFCGIFKNDTHEVHRDILMSSRKWRRQTKTRRIDKLVNFVFHQSWRLSPRVVNLNQQNVTRMFEEHLYILGMVDLATLARVIHIVGGRSTRIGE